MNTIRESIGFVVAAVLILGFLGLAGFSFYGFLHAEEAPYPAAPITTPVAPQKDNDEWKREAKKLEARLAALERAEAMPQRIAHDASSSVALVVGEYIWTDRWGRRPLRYQGLDDNGAPLADAQGRELVAFDGDGPIVVRNFTGTGFLLKSGKVLTSGFVLSPWYADPLLDENDEPERIPSIRFLHAYFPSHPKAVELKIDRVQEEATIVLCSIEGGPIPAPGLELSKTNVRTGEAVISIGYPGGVPMLASRLSNDARRELFKFGSNNTDELATWLAEHGFIQPVLTEAHVSALTDGNIFYDTLNAPGNTGSPLLDDRGMVAGMSEAINADYPSLNRAWPISSFRN